jgi:hypothetical protein
VSGEHDLAPFLNSTHNQSPFLLFVDNVSQGQESNKRANDLHQSDLPHHEQHQQLPEMLSNVEMATPTPPQQPPQEQPTDTSIHQTSNIEHSIEQPAGEVASQSNKVDDLEQPTKNDTDLEMKNPFDLPEDYPAQSPVPMDLPEGTVEVVVETIATGEVAEETTMTEIPTETLETLTVPTARSMETKARSETPQPILQPDPINTDKDPTVSFQEISSSAPPTPKLKKKTPKMKRKVIPKKSKKVEEDKSEIPSKNERQNLDKCYSKQEAVLDDNLNVSSLEPDVTEDSTVAISSLLSPSKNVLVSICPPPTPPPHLLLGEVIDEAVKLLEKEGAVSTPTTPTTLTTGQPRSAGQVLGCQETNNYSLSSSSQFLSRNVSEERKLDSTAADNLECKTSLHKKCEADLSSQQQQQQAATNDEQNFNTQERTVVNHSQSVAERANDDIKNDADACIDVEEASFSAVSSTNNHLKQSTETSTGSSPRLCKGKPPLQRKKSINFEKAEQWLRERKQKTPKPGDENDLEKEVAKQKNDQEPPIQLEGEREPVKTQDKEEPVPEEARERKNKEPKPEAEPAIVAIRQEEPAEPVQHIIRELQVVEEVKECLSKVVLTSQPPVVPANRVPNGLEFYQEKSTTSPTRDVRSPTPTQSTSIPSRFRNLAKSTRIFERAPSTPPMVFSKESSVPRRGSIFDQCQSRASSTLKSPDESRATSPTSRHTSPSNKFEEPPRTRPYFSQARMATVVPTSNMQRSKSFIHVNDDKSSSKPWVSPMNRDWKQTYDSKAFTYNARSRNTPVRDEPINAGPKVLERPSKFIKSVTPGPREDRPPRPQHPTTLDYNTSRDKIPSRFRRAMNHSSSTTVTSGMTRSRSFYQLNEEADNKPSSHLQDQIKKAKDDHRRVFDDAKSHTSYQREQDYSRSKLLTADTVRSSSQTSSTSSTRPRETTGDWLSRTASVRNLRASPTMEYGRL